MYLKSLAAVLACSGVAAAQCGSNYNYRQNYHQNYNTVTVVPVVATLVTPYVPTIAIVPGQVGTPPPVAPQQPPQTTPQVPQTVPQVSPPVPQVPAPPSVQVPVAPIVGFGEAFAFGGHHGGFFNHNERIVEVVKEVPKKGKKKKG